MKMKILSALLAFAMILGMMPMAAFAEDIETAEATETVEVTESVEATESVQTAEPVLLSAVYVNPLYADVIDAQELESVYHQNQVFNSGIEAVSENDCYTTPAEAAVILREAMENRETAVVIPYEIPASCLEYEDGVLDLCMEMFEYAYAHTGVPTQGDYLRWHYMAWGFKGITGYWNDDMTAVYADLPFTIQYHTDAAQEAAVTTAVDSLLTELNPTGTDYQKIKTVYDWMCNNIVYDYDNLTDATYYLKYSAYAALIDRTSVCQGYANLLYRLALEMGIDCRIITGYSLNSDGDPEAHAWNIVKLGDSYYNLDATWDAPYAERGWEYNYFLKSQDGFENHTRNADYTTSAFNAAYPMSGEDFDPSQDAEEDENLIASGTCDEFLTWTLDAEGTLTVSGTGLMGDFGRNDPAPWYDWKNDIKTAVIEDGVTSIGALAFRECVNLANVEIADTVTTIGLGAFWDCDSLTDIVIPDSVTTLESCFHTSIQNVTLSKNLTMIDQGMFANCANLTSIVIPEGVTSLEKGVFFGCKNLKSVTLPSTLTKIGHEVFYGCTSLKMVAIPEKVTEIGGDAFQNTGLTSIEIPASVTTIWEGAFRECEKLTGIWVDKDNTVYSSDASGALLDKEQKTLLQVPGGLSGTYEIPDTVTTIDGYAVNACEMLTEVKIPDSVTTIESGAFSGCTGLKNITIPDSITNIGQWTFAGCSDLTVVVLPDTVNEIAESAFDDCDRIWHVLFVGTEEQWNAITIAKNNTALKKATRHYNAKGDEVIAVNKTTCTEKIFCECTICGAVLSEEIPGGGHNMGNWTTTKEATCTEDGSKSRTCSKCDHTETEVIAATGHNHVPTVTAPDCVNGGYTTYTCACGDTYVADEVPALGHDMGDWVITDATCTVDGSKTRACTRCDHTETEVIAATGHNHVPTVTVPDCVNGGYTTYTCACGDTYVADEVPALGHDMGDWVITDATCTADGSKTRTCRREGCDHSETEVITAPGHSHVPTVTAPDCVNGGYTTYTCACGDSYTADETAALGHEYDYSLTAAPTVSASGQLTGTCTRCADEIGITLPKLNKDDYDYAVLTEPTEEAEGLARYTWKDTTYGAYSFDVTLNKLGSVILGDVNGDGSVGIADLMRLANHFAKRVEINEANADVNGDGKVTIADLMRLANFFAGKAQLG